MTAPAAACRSDHRHDTALAYNTDGCRCDLARRAHARDAKLRRLELLDGTGPRLVDSAGTCRRLRALMAIGWPKAHLAARLGVSTVRVDRLLADRSVRRPTAGRVRDLYAALADTAGPSAYTSGHARSRGYIPPVGWDDDTIDDPAALPWLELSPSGEVTTSARPCPTEGCRGYAVGKRRYCSDRCALAARRATWRAKQARKTREGGMNGLGEVR